jgi:hypothetical protein
MTQQSTNRSPAVTQSQYRRGRLMVRDLEMFLAAELAQGPDMRGSAPTGNGPARQQISGALYSRQTSPEGRTC